MGRSKNKKRCPKCGSKHIILQDTSDDGIDLYICVKCDREFEVESHGNDKLDDDDLDFNEEDEVIDRYERQSSDDEDEWN